jgi:hypothetical protein
MRNAKRRIVSFWIDIGKHTSAGGEGSNFRPKFFQRSLIVPVTTITTSTVRLRSLVHRPTICSTPETSNSSFHEWAQARL